MSKIFDALKDAERANRSRQGLAAPQEPSAPNAFIVRPTDSAGPRDSRARTHARRSRHGMSRHVIWLLLGVLLLSAAVVFVVHHARGARANRQATVMQSAGSVPEIPSRSPSGGQSTLALPATLSADVPGFVIQVASMKQENNAEALEKTLHQKHFPAFVFRRGAAAFYQVAIGVYGDSLSAVRVKSELESQGFEAILRRWLPE